MIYYHVVVYVNDIDSAEQAPTEDGKSCGGTFSLVTLNIDAEVPMRKSPMIGQLMTPRTLRKMRG
jgi:hypothetical protein